MGQAEAHGAAETLAEVARVRDRARRTAHGGAWLPAGLMAALLVGSAALYTSPFAEHPPETLVLVEHPFWAGLPDAQRSPLASHLYWFLGLPTVIALSALWYRRRARRHGMVVRWGWFAGVGLGALFILAVLATIPGRAIPHETSGPLPALRLELLAGSGLLTPLLVAAAAVLALGWIERSRVLAACGLWAGLIAAWQCAYGYQLGEIPGWLDWILSGFDGPALGGQLTVLGLHTAGFTLLVMAAPLAVFAVAGATRAVWARP